MTLMRIAAAPLAAALGVAVAFAAVSTETPSGLQEIYAESRNRVVGVTYMLKAMEAEAGSEGPKAEGAICGVVGDANGLILIPADIFPEPGGDPRATLAPADFKIHLQGASESPATPVGIDRDLNIAFLRADPNAVYLLRPVKFRESPPLQVGDAVVIVGALGRKYGFAPAIFKATINAAVEGAVPLFSVDTIVQDLSVGGLVVRRDGSAAGIVTKDLLAGEPEDTRSPGNLISIIANMGTPQMRRAGYAVILPYTAFSARMASPPPLDLVSDLKRAWIGIVMQALSTDLRDYWKLPVPGGIIVGSVVEGSPAQSAGIRQGDILTGFDGEPMRIVEDSQLAEFRRRIEVMGVGREVRVDLFRGGEPLQLKLVLGEAPKTASRAEEYEDEEFGLTVREITIDAQQALNLDPNFNGVVVAETEESGWADVAGILPEDVILSINGTKVTTVGETREILQAIKRGREPEAILFLMRPPDTLFVRVRTDYEDRSRKSQPPGDGAP